MREMYRCRLNFPLLGLFLLNVVSHSSSGSLLQLDRIGGDTNVDTPFYTIGRPANRTECARENTWKCASLKKCIPRESKCDGIKDCDDGSDEDVKECGANVNFRGPRVDSPNDGICDVPSGPLKTLYTVGDNENWQSISPGSKVPKFTRITVTCNPGYLLSSGEHVQESLCFRKDQWNPPLRPCQKTCPKLHPKNVDLSCFFDERKIDCNRDAVNGTVVRPQCKPMFHRENSETYRDLTCQSNGEWDNVLFKCVPDCGTPPTTMETLIYEGSPTKPSDSPWHVAIYDIKKDQILICGGTLISPRMILSAAHCFFDKLRGKAANRTTDYEIVVGKYTRDYKKKDTDYQKNYKIRNLIFTDTGYNPTLTGQYGHDIIVIELEKNVELSEFVLPACIEWSASSTSGFKTREGTIGKLSGWGENEVADEGNAVLLSAELPFISYHKCVGLIHRLSYDNFCAGTQTGPGPRKGDSGGGLVFLEPHKNLYFLRGIVSTKDKNSSSSIATFTDVSRHLDWLNAVRNKVEENTMETEVTCRSYNTAGTTWSCRKTSECKETAELINTGQEFRCGSDKNVEKICCPERKSPLPSHHTYTSTFEPSPSETTGRMPLVTSPHKDPKPTTSVTKEVEMTTGHAGSVTKEKHPNTSEKVTTKEPGNLLSLNLPLGVSIG